MNYYDRNEEFLVKGQSMYSLDGRVAIFSPDPHWYENNEDDMVEIDGSNIYLNNWIVFDIDAMSYKECQRACRSLCKPNGQAHTLFADRMYNLLREEAENTEVIIEEGKNTVYVDATQGECL